MFSFVFEAGSYYIAQADLKLAMYSGDLGDLKFVSFLPPLIEY